MNRKNLITIFKTCELLAHSDDYVEKSLNNMIDEYKLKENLILVSSLMSYLNVLKKFDEDLSNYLFNYFYSEQGAKVKRDEALAFLMQKYKV